MKQIYISATILVIFMGFSFCQISNDLDVDDIEKQLKEQFNLNGSKVPSEEDVERLLKEKCIKNGGGEEAYNALKNQQSAIQTCLEAQINSTEIQMEVEEAKKTGSMDEVFGKYCKKYPEVYKCVETVIDKIKPCLELQEQKTMNKSLEILGELKEFVCFKDGDRIAMFIAEGGPECLESKKEQLQTCANKTLGSRIPMEASIQSLPMLMFTDRECSDFDKIRACFNEELEKCKDSTPANIVDAFFKFLKNHLPCDSAPAAGKSTLSKEKDGSGSSSVMLGAPSILFGISIVVSKLV